MPGALSRTSGKGIVSPPIETIINHLGYFANARNDSSGALNFWLRLRFKNGGAERPPMPEDMGAKIERVFNEYPKSLRERKKSIKTIGGR